MTMMAMLIRILKVVGSMSSPWLNPQITAVRTSQASTIFRFHNHKVFTARFVIRVTVDYQFGQLRARNFFAACNSGRLPSPRSPSVVSFA